MWSDNETDRDFLNFGFVAEIAAEMIVQAQGQPLSVGISGSWGVGKSSMMKLLAKSLRDRTDEQFLFVEFNAWLYQGYDDTRAALMEVIARAILQRAESEKDVVSGVLEKAKGLVKRVNWFRLASVSASTVAALAVGLPPVGLIGEGFAAFKGLTDGKVTKEDLEGAGKVAGGVKDAGLLHEEKTQAVETPPKEIQEFRDELKETLEKLNLRLVVLIDDLDRCLPATAISTLEAMRLFLFMERTAFIIAADDEMIRRAVRSHFGDAQLTDDLVTNYFDKLIQVPIRVPPLGTQDVRAYLMLLFIENSDLAPHDKETIRGKICERLGETWAGKRLDRNFVESLINDCPIELALQLDLADRIAPILTRSSKVAGNPRLIKRFLNTLSLRKAIAKVQKVTLDETALTKMLLFERCGSEAAYAELITAINESDDGKAAFLRRLEESAAKEGASLKLEGEWNNDFAREWLTLDPPLGDVDLRGIVYVSRERLPIISAADRLSAEGASVLEALAKITTASAPLAEKLKALPPHELTLISERMLARARNIEQWGTPPVVHALVMLAGVSGEHVGTIGRFFEGLSGSKLTPAIVPLLTDKPWAENALRAWATADAPDPVKKAIASASRKKGAG